MHNFSKLNRLSNSQNSKASPNWRNIFKLTKIPIFLPLIVVSIALFASVATGIVGYVNGQEGLEKATVGELNTLASSRSKILSLKVKSLESDLSAMALSSATQTVISELNGSLKNAEDDIPTILEYFQTPTAAHERAELDGAGEKNMYAYGHTGIHKSFSANWSASGYGEIYILNPEGRIIYSVSKPWSQEALKTGMRRILNTDIMLPLKEKNLTLHGLRKSATEKLYEADCNKKEIAAITGMSYETINHYLAYFDHTKLAQNAIDKWRKNDEK